MNAPSISTLPQLEFSTNASQEYKESALEIRKNRVVRFVAPKSNPVKAATGRGTG
jgi:hypothetical protein